MRTIEWHNGKVRMIDQTLLPHKLKLIYVRTVSEMVRAIKTMQVRGAPAIGAAGAFGCVLGANDLEKAAKKLVAARPTAVNLQWGVERMLSAARAGKNLLEEALKIAEEDVATNKQIGLHGAQLIRDDMGVLTVCNAGALATVDYGTALGVIRAAFDLGKKFYVFSSETRPRLQGAKLTAWELKKMGVPFTLITDNMIGHFMQKGKINLCVVGADRITRNGDTANKIGTYGAAVLARAHRIPFYIAAPFSTIDFSTPSGDKIVIEERDASEVTNIGCERITPKGVKVANPSFDVTPAKYITGIITERGVFKPSALTR